MQTVLFVTSNLDYGGAARQLTLLASGLPSAGFRARVVVMGLESPWVARLREQSVEVETLGWRRPFDVLPLAALRRLVKSQRADVLHVWGRSALRTLVLTGSSPSSRLLVSNALSFAQSPNRFDRWLLRHATGILSFGSAETERYRRIGVAAQRIHVVAPAMTIASDLGHPEGLFGVGASERVILGLGPIERHKGFREAVWAFDIVRHLYPDVRLVLAGVGSDLPRVRRFANDIGVDRAVVFLGAYADTTPLLRRAEVLWAPSLQGGKCAVLEAMAAGRAVVASRCADLSELVKEGVTGYLVEPDNKAALARQTRLLLDDPNLAQRMGEAGRQRVRDHYSTDRLIQACAGIYAGITSR